MISLPSRSSLPLFNTVTARAHSNIALIKYWGKADATLNLPAVASLSMTLGGFGTTTSVSLTDIDRDSFTLNGLPQSGERLQRVTEFLDLIRTLAQCDTKVHVQSENTVPTAAGLASSASGFAALSLAATKAFGLELDVGVLSALARRGSASAARSIVGPFTMLPRGQRERCGKWLPDMCIARPVEPHPDLDLGMVVAVCARGEKQTSSRAGMSHTAQSSPYYGAWIESHDADMEAALGALKSGDFHALGQAMEHSTLKMHACMMAAKPPLVYWNAATLSAMEVAATLRDADGERIAYFTMDAGPHVKLLCRRSAMNEVAKALKTLPKLVDVLQALPGTGAEVL